MRPSPMNVAITGFSNPHANHQLTTTHRMVNGTRIFCALTLQVNGLPENINQGAVRSMAHTTPCMNLNKCGQII